MDKRNLCLATNMVVTILLMSSVVKGQEAKRAGGCGEECVKMICRFYDMDVNERDIEYLLEQNEKGETNFYALSKCFNEIGLDCYAFKGTMEDLFKISYPIVVHVRQKKINHFFVVLLDKVNNKLIGYDPAKGAIHGEINNVEKFKKDWTGVGLAVMPKKQKLISSNIILLLSIGSFSFGCLSAVTIHYKIR